MTRRTRRSDCPINFGVELFGDKWTLLIVRDLLFKGKVHYGDFLGSEEKIATNILASRLQSMEEAGLIEKTIDPHNRTKLIYSLTDKGIDLAPMLVELILWSARHDPESAADPAFVDRAKRDRDGLLAEITRNAREQAG